MKKIVIMLFALLAFSGAAFAQHGEEAEIIALENLWNQAELHLDAHAIESILTQDFVLTSFDGSVQTRGQYLATVRDKDYHPQVLQSSNMNVHLYGTTAVVSGDYKEKGTQKGKPFEHHGKLTDTWVKINGKWQCVSSALTEQK